MNVNELRILFEQECKAMEDLYEVDLEPNIDFETYGYISMETQAMFHIYEVAYNHGVQMGIPQRTKTEEEGAKAGRKNP